MPSITKETLKFLKQLQDNNNKPWFEANRAVYEAVRENFIVFTGELIRGVAKFDPPIGTLEARKTIFRINRDIRFSKDKSPYKNNFGATLSAGGKNMQTAGYYLQIQPGNNSFLAAGSYMPEPDKLAKIRQEIDYNLKEFNSILKAAAFKKHFGELGDFDKLKTNPKGYASDNPAIELLKYKSFVVTQNFTDKEVTDPGYISEVIKACKTAYPLIKFLNAALES